MFKLFGIALVVVALAVALIPQFTDCQSQGKAIALASGKTVPMKCHWTARGEIALAVPTLAVGAMMVASRRKETTRYLALTGAVLGIFVMALPTKLIGVCSSAMLCNTVMKPSLLGLGAVVTAIGVVGLVMARRD